MIDHRPTLRSTATGASSRSAKQGLLRTCLTVIACTGLVIVLLVAALLGAVIINPNPLRQPVAQLASDALGRQVAINGDLHLGIRHGLEIDLNDLVIGNTTWANAADFLTLERATLIIALRPLLQGRLELAKLALIKPQLSLETAANGDSNWNFKSKTEDTSESRPVPVISALQIDGGKLSYRDQKTDTRIALNLNSERRNEQQSRLSVSGQGRWHGEDFHLRGRIDSLLALASNAKPFWIDMKASVERTEAAFTGTVVPLKLDSIKGQVRLRGNDLSKLSSFLGIALPWTSTYRLSGKLQRTGDSYELSGLDGKVGKSDLAGRLLLTFSKQRPRLQADLKSKRLDYHDLGGFVGVPPPQGSEPQPLEQKQEAQQREQAQKLFSSSPYQLDALRRADASVTFKGEKILIRDIPLDNLYVKLELDGGKLKLDPLDFGLASGHAVSTLNVDAAGDLVHSQMNTTLSAIEAAELMPTLASKNGKDTAGKIGGRAKLSMQGHSVAELAGSANGEIALLMGKGRANTISLLLTNLDLANVTQYLLRGNPSAPVYCAVIDAAITDGIVVPNIFVIDSSEEHIEGKGSVDLKREHYDLRLVADSKSPSLLALRGPIQITGSFVDPQIKPEKAPLAARAGAAIALGVLATPLASLLALVDLGDAPDSNCTALTRKAKDAVKQAPDSTPVYEPPKPKNRTRKPRPR